MLDSKDEIKQKTDIVDLIGEYLTLKPAGTHGFKATCPFHSEKTPSFHVSSDRQIWHCFGCGEGGDCFSFVMKMEGMDFAEVLLHLGQKVGVEVRRMVSTDGNRKQRLYEMNNLASRFYQKVFEQSPLAQGARVYVMGRGITSELYEKFGLGYATEAWDALTQFLLKRGYSETEIIAAGLGQKRKSGSGTIDRFRDRLMIPLRDQHGKTVGFTARLLPSSDTSHTSDTSPKYINSPETPIYHKGRLLYGLDFAKRAAKEHKAIIVVEGNLDVVASHKAGVEHVVASSGTALTSDHLQLLSRYVKALIFCFDRDAAGLIAAKRGVTIARQLGFDVRAIVLPEGVKDPDELVQQDPNAWKSLCTHSVPFMEYLIGRVTEGKDLTDVDDKRLISQELLPALEEITDVVEHEHWARVVAGILGVQPDQLRRGKMSNTKNVQQTPTRERLSKAQHAQALLLGAWVIGVSEEPDALPDDGEFGELYTAAKRLYTSPSYAPSQSFFSRLREALQGQEREDLIRLLDQISMLAQISFADLPPSSVQQQVQDLKKVLLRERVQKKCRDLAHSIRQAELAGDQEAVERLIVEFTYAQKNHPQKGDEEEGHSEEESVG